MRHFPFIRLGFFIAFLPIVLAFITSVFQGGSMWDEGSGTGRYIWLMMVSVPLGLLLVLIGLVKRVVQQLR
jgi:di/tricarboxylate transporter